MIVGLPIKATAPPFQAVLLAVGDIMMHTSQIKAGYNPLSQQYDYGHFFEEVKPLLQTGDWVTGNLETTLAGKEHTYSGYPIFNAPEVLAKNLCEAGFNVIVTANNHAFDKGEIGIINTLHHLKQNNLCAVGTATSPAAAEHIHIIEKNGIRMAFLAYTGLINFHIIPLTPPHLVATIEEKKIIQQISLAKQQGADIVTISLHIGEEYKRLPSQRTKKLVSKLIQAGADIILGGHPHVLQPYQLFNLQHEDGTQRTAVAIYSLGNFISDFLGSGKYIRLGVILEVNISRTPDGQVRISHVEVHPTWVHRFRKGKDYDFKVLLLKQVLQQESKYKHLVDTLILKQYYIEIMEHLKSFIVLK